MTERFNSGRGGYTCDGCGALLWAGFNGLEKPANRGYIYGIQSEDVFIRDDGTAVCKKCKVTKLDT